GGRLAFGAKMSEPGHKFWRYCLTCSVDEQNSRRYTGLLRAHPVAQGEPTTYGQKKVSFRFSLLGGRTIGSTSDSGSDYPGSSPGLPAKTHPRFTRESGAVSGRREAPRVLSRLWLIERLPVRFESRLILQSD